MAPSYDADDDTIRGLRSYDQLLCAALHSRMVLNHYPHLLRQARVLIEQLGGYIPPLIRANLFYEQCLHCLWDLSRYLRAYRRQRGNERQPSLQGLYALKHTLLERMVLLANLCVAFSWEAGRASDSATEISIRLVFRTVDGRRRAKHVHWPIEHIPEAVRTLMVERYGQFPPPEELPQDDQEPD